jgi:hypothetical protein
VQGLIARGLIRRSDIETWKNIMAALDPKIGPEGAVKLSEERAVAQQPVAPTPGRLKEYLGDGPTNKGRIRNGDLVEVIQGKSSIDSQEERLRVFLISYWTLRGVDDEKIRELLRAMIDHTGTKEAFVVGAGNVVAHLVEEDQETAMKAVVLSSQATYTYR